MTLAQLIDNPFLMVLAILTVILGSGRLTRVLVYDDFPPAIALRMAWDRMTNDGPWTKLAHCWWCASFWVTLFCIGWFMWGQIDGWAFLNVAWWIVWGGLGLSYVAAIIIARDEPPSVDR